MTSNRSVSFSTKAVDDFANFIQYTGEMWGLNQQGIYGKRMLSAIMDLGNFPASGISQDRLAPGLRVKPIEQHRVFYTYDDAVVHIARILHKRMDPARFDWSKDLELDET